MRDKEDAYRDAASVQLPAAKAALPRRRRSSAVVAPEAGGGGDGGGARAWAPQHPTPAGLAREAAAQADTAARASAASRVAWVRCAWACMGGMGAIKRGRVAVMKEERGLFVFKPPSSSFLFFSPRRAAPHARPATTPPHTPSTLTSMATKSVPTTCRDALAAWEKKTGSDPATAERVELWGCRPPIEKMDAGLAGLGACR